MRCVNALLLPEGWQPPKPSSYGVAAAASPHPACLPDFAATAMQGRSHMFEIQAGLLLARCTCRGADSTGSCSVSKGFGQQGWQAMPAGCIGHGATLPWVGQTRCGISRVGVGCGALLLRVSQMHCSVGGVGVGRGTMLPRVGGLCCSVSRDESCQWALLPGSSGMRCGVGGNGACQGATSLFVGGASYGIGVSHGASCGIGGFGVTQALYGTLPQSCNATLKWCALARKALLLLPPCNMTCKCCALAHEALSLFGAINMMEGLMLCLLGAMCCALAQVQMVKCWRKLNEMLCLGAVKSLRYTNVTNDVILRLVAFTTGMVCQWNCYDMCFGTNAIVRM